ncbi:aspartate/glutamate racemase family protein [Candidatus Woesearchaeota archaeon]|nr:aspartate/glutamate racemase family protein [Candidatus Woesearchaeota archaeon]
MSPKIKIGILGGIGPEATAEFYSKLIYTLQKEKLIKSNKDYPQIIINSIPAPELIYEKILKEDLKPYIEGLKELDKFNPDFIVMVCNTIHLYYERLQKEVKTPIIDLRKEVKEYLIKNKIKSAFILGTPNTVKQGLYKFKNIRCFNPDNRELKILSKSIFDFNKGYKKEEQIEKTRSICRKYIEKGAETIILGCTEFAVMLKNENIPKINIIDILVDAVIERFISKSSDDR